MTTVVYPNGGRVATNGQRGDYVPIATAETVRIYPEGKELFVTTDDRDYLIGNNEYVLDTTKRSTWPYGGANEASAAPDNTVGTVRVVSGTGITLSPRDESVKSTVLNAGYLVAKSDLVIDKGSRAITGYFTIHNDGNGDDIQVISDGTDATGWGGIAGTNVVCVSENGRVKVTGTTNASGALAAYILFNPVRDYSAYDFWGFTIETPIDCNLRASIKSDDPTLLTWENVSRLAAVANTPSKVVLPLDMLNTSNVGIYPTGRSGTYTKTTVKYLVFGMYGTPSTEYTFYIDDVHIGKCTWANIEIGVPDKLMNYFPAYPTSYKVYVSAYNPNTSAYGSSMLSVGGAGELDSNSGNGFYLDGTKIGAFCGGTSNYDPCGAGIYFAGNAGETVDLGATCAGPATMTYSNDGGANNRIGLTILMPPTSHRANMHKARIKYVLFYADDDIAVVPDLSGHGNHGSLTGFAPVKLQRGLRTTHTGVEANDGRVTFGTAPTFLRRNGSFTVFGRLKINSPQHGNLMGQWYGGNASLSAFNLYISITNSVQFMIAQGSSVKNVISTVSLTTGTEAFVAGVFDKELGKVQVYKDSIMTEGSTTLTGVNTPATALYIGGYQTLGLDADIYQVCYVPRAMTAAELSLASAGTIPADATGLWEPALNCPGYSTFELVDTTEIGTGLRNMSKPTLCLYDSSIADVDVLTFTDRPTSINVVKDENGVTQYIDIDLGNGSLYHDIYTTGDRTTDSDTDLIPNFIDQIKTLIECERFNDQ